MLLLVVVTVAVSAVELSLTQKQRTDNECSVSATAISTSRFLIQPSLWRSLSHKFLWQRLKFISSSSSSKTAREAENFSLAWQPV